MKKFLLIFIAICSISSAFSQTGKGKMFAGCRASYYSSKIPKTKYSFDVSEKHLSRSVSPEFGYFITEHLSVGAAFNYAYSNDRYFYDVLYDICIDNLSKITVSKYGFALFSSYYKNISGNFYFSITANLKYTYANETRIDSLNFDQKFWIFGETLEQRTTSNIFSLEFEPSLLYFINPKFSIRAGFGNLYYGHSISSKKMDYTAMFHHFPSHISNLKTNDMGFNFNITTLSLGLNYYF